jgi:hypothetical protein
MLLESRSIPIPSRLLYVLFTVHIDISIYLCNKNQLDAGRPANRQSTKKHNTYQLLYIYIYIYIYIYSFPPDDGLQICPKHVQIDWRNKLRINSASSWFSLHRPFYTIIIRQPYSLSIKLINKEINTNIPTYKDRSQNRTYNISLKHETV